MDIVDPCGQVLKDVLAFLEQPEHEIVRVYTDDHQKEPIYCGLALSWEEERDALLQRLRQVVPEENQFYMLVTRRGRGTPHIYFDDCEYDEDEGDERCSVM